MRRGDFVCSEFRSEYGSANIFQQTSLSDYVANIGNVVKDNRFRSEQRCCHARQRRILSSTNRNSAAKRSAATDAKLIHDADRLIEKRERLKLGCEDSIIASCLRSWAFGLCSAKLKGPKPKT